MRRRYHYANGFRQRRMELRLYHSGHSWLYYRYGNRRAGRHHQYHLYLIDRVQGDESDNGKRIAIGNNGHNYYLRRLDDHP
jgi:hypothetical protein